MAETNNFPGWSSSHTHLQSSNYPWTDLQRHPSPLNTHTQATSHVVLLGKSIHGGSFIRITGRDLFTAVRIVKRAAIHNIKITL